jgi:hypothetical protein
MGWILKAAEIEWGLADIAALKAGSTTVLIQSGKGVVLGREAALAKSASEYAGLKEISIIGRDRNTKLVQKTI